MSQRFLSLFPSAMGGSGINQAAPEFSEASVGLPDCDIVIVTFDAPVNSPALGYDAGVTVKEDTVSATISSATRQSNKAIVHYALSAGVSIGGAVTFEYASASGDLENDSSAVAVADISAQTVTNYVGRVWNFGCTGNSGHLLTF